MITVDIKRANSDEVLRSIDLPQNMYEVPLNRYIDFIVAQRGFKTDEDSPSYNPAAVMGKCVSYFYGIDIEQLCDAQMFGDDAENLLYQTVESLYGYACGLVGNHSPSLRTFGQTVRIGDDDFIIPSNNVESFVGEKGNLSLLETIEAYEIRRTVRQRIINEGDEEGSLWYSEYLNLLAVLLRKEGEKLPLDDRIRGKFIEDRTIAFQKVDAGTALDVDFFLTRCLLSMNKTSYLVGSLILSAAATAEEVRPRQKQSLGRSKQRRTHLIASVLDGFTKRQLTSKRSIGQA